MTERHKESDMTRLLVVGLIAVGLTVAASAQAPELPKTAADIPIKLIGADTTPVWLDEKGQDTVPLGQVRTLLTNRKAIGQAIQQLPALEARIKELLADSITARQHELDIRNGLWVRAADVQKAIADARATDLAAFEKANPGQTLKAGKVVAK
jgi:hypothetical protein